MPITGLVNPELIGLNIGKSQFASNSWMNGKIDEVRVTNVVRDDSWIKTEYNNIAFPSVFATVGEEMQRGGGSKYGSPLHFDGVSNQWIWSNFTWQNPEIPEGKQIGWRIYYIDSSNNEIATDIIIFTVGTQTIPNPPATPMDVTTWHTDLNDLNKGIGAKEIQYTYSTYSTAENNLYYRFFWGDGSNSGWIGPYNSGQTATASHAYATVGTFSITVTVKHGTTGIPSNPSPARSVRMFKLGDVQGDNKVTFADIDPFVAALGGKTAFYATSPTMYWYTADCNLDNMVTFADIDPFVQLLGQ